MLGRVHAAPTAEITGARPSENFDIVNENGYVAGPDIAVIHRLRADFHGKRHG